MKYFVLTHKNCIDGFTSAFLAHRALSIQGIEMEHLECTYQEPLPETFWSSVGDNPVIIADFSFQPDVMQRLCDRGPVHLLDHHKSAFESLGNFQHANLVTKTLDNNRSGAMLVYDFFSKHLQDRPDWVPLRTLALYVQDHDLWRHEMALTKEVHAILEVTDKTFQEYKRFATILHEEFGYVASLGEAILQAKQHTISQILTQHTSANLQGRWVSIVNSPVYKSELGNLLAKDSPSSIGVVWHENGKGNIEVSLRSIGDVDVSTLAKQYGGGGHRNASGLMIPSKDLKSIFVPVI